VLGAYGDGGMVITNDDVTERNLRRLRYYGMEETYYVVSEGMNSRLDDVQAEILRGKLKKLSGYIERRRELAERYGRELAGTPLTLPREMPGNFHVYYVYVVRHPKRDAVLEALKGRGINLNVSYRWPNHLMSGFSQLGYAKGDLPHTEAAADEIFSLPMFPSLTDEEHAVTCQTLREVSTTV
jgi:aminotransferase EvaB